MFRVLCILTLGLGAVIATDPVLSTPGASVVLAFLDLHNSYHGSTCSDPDWDMFDVAFRLYWDSLQTNNTGVEIYDTCGSYRRVAAILRNRISTSRCNTSEIQPPISGVISSSTAEINDVITSNVNNVHVVLRERRNVRPKLADEVLFADIPSFANIKILSATLARFNWTYISTVADDNPVSQEEHQAFLDRVRDGNICIQHSQTLSEFQDMYVADVQTDGIVVFTTDISNVKHLATNLSIAKPVVIVTHDRRTDYFRYMQHAIVLSDAYHADTEYSDYMSVTFWNETSNIMVAEYYKMKFNCTLDQSIAVTDCPDVEEMRAHFFERTSSRDMRVFDGVFNLLAGISNAMSDTNCTDYDKTCLTEDMFGGSDMFSGVQNHTLVPRSPYSVTVTMVEGGSITKAAEFAVINLLDVATEVVTFLDSNWSFPVSNCSGWCPACVMSECRESMAASGLFDGDFLYIPGDILIAGLIPVSQNWHKLGHSKICSGLNILDNIDIMSEAFTYAVTSARDRYPTMLKNVTVGALLFDTCSDTSRASQIMLNFESCAYSFIQEGSGQTPTPYVTPVYLVFDYKQERSEILRETASVGKLAVGLDKHGSLYNTAGVMYDSNNYNFNAVTSFLDHMDWTFVGVLSSINMSSSFEGLYENARSKNICIAYHGKISSMMKDLAVAIKTVEGSAANTVVVFASADDIDALFVYLTSKSVVKTWVLVESRENWLTPDDYPLQLGTIVLERQNKQDGDFNSHISQRYSGNTLNSDSSNSWLNIYKTARESQNMQSPILDGLTLIQASDVIRAVDISLAVLNEATRKLCGNSSRLCQEFLTNGPEQVTREMQDVWFENQADDAKMDATTTAYDNYVITNLQTTGYKEVGRWIDGELTMFTDTIKSYSSQNVELSVIRSSRCYNPPCLCSNINATDDSNDVTQTKTLDQAMGYVRSTAEFKPDLWKIIVVIIAGSGVLMTLVLLLYILCKVCSGRLIRRYLVIGIPMIIAMLLLFLSVLPFVFTPSEEVCGMRYFAHGFSHSLCFASLLSKMMSLRDYKFVGLGGNVSKLNQLLLILFIISVQIAIGVQWWVLRAPVLLTEVLTEQYNGGLTQTTYYACDFNRNDFVAYHAYVIFLIVLCCLYSLGIRSETKDSKDISARVLTVCSWFCLVLWIAIVVTLLVLDRHLLEAVCAIGLLAVALSVLVIVFLPTISAISRLKYDVSDKKRQENGYKLDPDFQFERPYSLPGTLHSAITDKNMTYPRSLATFDTSLSY